MSVFYIEIHNVYSNGQIFNEWGDYLGFSK